MRLSAEVKENSKLVKEIARSIYDYMYEFVFREALEIVQDSQENEMQNAIPKSSMALILRAIREANIIIDNRGNIYVKRPNAQLSRAIQKLNPTKNRIPKAERESLTRRPDYRIDLRKFPDIAEAQRVKNDSYRQNVSRLNILVQEKQAKIDAEIKRGRPDFKIPEEKLDPLIEDILKKVHVSIPSKEEEFGIKMKVDKEVVKQFKDEYLRTTSLPIVDMEQRAINRMRKEVLPLVVEQGILPQDLAKFLEKEFGESKRHAEFLARQEIKIIKSKIIKDRALRTGHSKYIWRTAGDERVRSLHKELNGKHCDFNTPPIIDKEGNRGNPGEAYNCRCIARIILDE